MISRTSAWLGLVSSTIVVALYLIMRSSQGNRLPLECMSMHDSEIGCANFWNFRTFNPDSIVKSSGSHPVRVVDDAGRFRTFLSFRFRRSLPVWIHCFYDSCTHHYNVLISVRCEEKSGILNRRKETPVYVLLITSTRNIARMKRLSQKICRLQSLWRIELEGRILLPRLKFEQIYSCKFQSSRARDTELRKISTSTELLRGIHKHRNFAIFLEYQISSIVDLLQPPHDPLDRAWLALRAVTEEREVFLLQPPYDPRRRGRLALRAVTEEREVFLRYLSMKFGDQDRRLRRLLAGTPGPSSGLHGKWRSIVIANSVIGALGFLVGLIALACCVCRRGPTLRFWWHFTCGFGEGDRHIIREVPDYESSPGMTTGGPLPPLSSPALYDLRMTLPDFRAASRQDSVESRSRRSQTGSGPLLYGAEAFPFETLAAATGGFAEENKIGAGSFGIVYRGVLADGRVVAIKRADRSNARKIEEKETAFEAELEVLSRLHHKHLVNLVGFCDDLDETMLVYEYMPNGTLHDHLHRHRSIALSSWQARIEVALQAARGIEYLHTYAGRQIIHRDIKSANILLDSKWNARVSDFGLSLVSPSEEHSHLTTGAAGTLGYMDPEYYRLQRLTTKSDVYSFGVVLMELLTGKKAIHRPNTSGLSVSPTDVSVVDYAVPPIRADELLSILDSRVRAPEESENAAVEIMAEVAEQCVRLEGKDRPAMAEIVTRLETAHALSGASESSILREYEAMPSAQIGPGPSRQLDSSKVPLDRHKGESLDLGASSSIPESQEYDSGSKLEPDDHEESSSPEQNV